MKLLTNVTPIFVPFGTALLLLLAGLSSLMLIGLSPAQMALAQGDVIYVDVDAPGPTHDGLSWTTAYTNVQDALAAAVAGDEIWVAEGVYYPDEGAGQTGDDPTSTFQLKSGVALYGGFDPGSGIDTFAERDWSTYVTVLSGDIDHETNPDTTDSSGVITDTANIAGSNAYHVLLGSGANKTAVLDGFTVTAGQANGDAYPNERAGGMYTLDGSPTLAHNIFCGNYSEYSGGAMYNNNSHMALNDVAFVANLAETHGGGMSNINSSLVLSDVTFIGNKAFSGGGMRNYYGSSILNHVTFTANVAITGSGGGMYNENSSPSLNHATFVKNTATSGGGGVSGGGIFNANSSPVLSHTTFISNAASSYGGGMSIDFGSDPVLTSVTFRGNTAKYGGGLYSKDASPTLTEVTFTLNTATKGGGGLYNSGGSAITLDRGAFIGNTATNGTDGGGLHNSVQGNIYMTNVLFSGNHASRNGGGLYNYILGNSTLVNVTFGGNTADDSGGGIYNSAATATGLTNTVLWGNTAATNDHIYNSGALTIDHSLVQDSGGSGAGWDTSLGTDGGGNIDVDPQFIDVDGTDNVAGTDDDNHRLQVDSPAIDAGNNDVLPAGALDLDNKPRFVDNISLTIRTC